MENKKPEPERGRALKAFGIDGMSRYKEASAAEEVAGREKVSDSYSSI